MKKSLLMMTALLCICPFTSLAQNGDKDLEKMDDEVIFYEYDFPYDIENYDDSILTNTSYKFYNDENDSANLEIDNFSDADVYINGNEVTDKDEISENIIEGKNTFDILNVKKPLKVKVESSKKESGMIDRDNKLDKKITDLLETILTEEVRQNFAGGQISVIRDDEYIYNYNFGYKNNFYKDGIPIPINKRQAVDEDTLFDLASNTKMYVTNYILQKLVYEKRINLDDKISNYFTEFKDDIGDPIKGKDNMTIRDILMHQAGFPADPQYHNENYDKDDGILNGKNDLYSQDRDDTIKMILKTPLQYEPGSKTIYSDVDYMLLGSIIEKVTGKRLDRYFDENFAKPLGLRRTLFNPLLNGFSKDDVAATELNGNTRDGVVSFNNIRKDTIQGEVHDEKAYYAMDGISGHAGLFSNSNELAKLANLMLNNGRYNDLIFWDKETQDEFSAPKQSNPSYGLGWRRMADGKYAWAFSNLASENTIGHTGWTGTLTVIDPLERLAFVLLTNKKNSPVLDNKKDPNTFYGDKSLSARYGAISTLIYKSLQDNSDQLIESIAQELKDGELRLIKENDGNIDEAQLNDYVALKNAYDTIKSNEEKEEARDNENSSTVIAEVNEELSQKMTRNIKDNSNKASNPKTGISDIGMIIGILMLSGITLKTVERREKC